MTRYVGLDVHRQFIDVCILDAGGRVLYRGRTGWLRNELEDFARTKLTPEDRVAREATTNTWSVVAVLRPFVAAVVVSNPLKTRAIAEAKVKTDKVDAEVLAQLLRCDYLPAVWHTSARTALPLICCGLIDRGAQVNLRILLRSDTPMYRTRNAIRSMCPKRIGGSAVRAAVWPTGARNIQLRRPKPIPVR
jgi:hypothetical protein